MSSHPTDLVSGVTATHHCQIPSSGDDSGVTGASRSLVTRWRKRAS